MTVARHFPMMESMTVQEVREYLGPRRSIIVPMGVIEQHGYHLPLCTDALIACEIAKRVGERTGILVAPTMHMSFSGGQLPGTINITPNVMGLVVADTLRSLAIQGFENLFLFLCHGGSENARALDDSLKLLLRDDPLFEKVMIVLAPVWKFSQGWKEAARVGDWHAGWLETSMVMELAPELVQMDKLNMDGPSLLELMRQHPDNYQYALKPMDDETVVPRMRQRMDMNVGVMGTPIEASPERGREIVTDVIERLTQHFVRLERERKDTYEPVAWTPAPILLDG